MPDLSRHLLIAAAVVIVIATVRLAKWWHSRPRCERCGAKRLRIEDVIRSDINEAGRKIYVHETTSVCGKCGHQSLYPRTTWVVPTDDELPPELIELKKKLNG